MTVISTKKLIEDSIENSAENRYKLAHWQVSSWSVETLIEYAIQEMESSYEQYHTVFVSDLETYCEDNMDLEVYGNNVKLRDIYWHMGIVDYYNEYITKIEEPPKEYADRFIEFI